MKNKNLAIRILGIIGVGILQYIAAMLITLLVSVMFPSFDKMIENNLPFFVVSLGLSYAIGIWLVGWLFIVMRWRKATFDFGLRFVTTVIGAYISLIIALMVYPKLEPGNPFFFIAVVTGIIGFLVPEWLPEEKEHSEPVI
jgi:hypothetical protein